jgi:hypothetical protein
MNVRFYVGTKKQYLSIASHNPDALYFCEDTKELFWGDRLLTDGIRVVPTFVDLPELSKAADGTVYYVEQTRNGYTLSPDRTKWIQTIYAPVIDVDKVPESEVYTTVTTVGAVRDIEVKIYETLEERIAEIDLPTKVSDFENDAGYITLADVPKPDLTGYATKAELPDVSKFITEVPAEYITENELIAKGYLTAHNLVGLATTQDVISVASDVAAVSTKVDILVGNADKYLTAIPSEYLTEEELSAKGYLTEQSLDDYAKKSDIPSVDKYVTEDFVRSEIAKAELNGGEVTEEELNNLLANYYKKNEVYTKSEVEALIPDVSEFIKEIPAEYITETELEAKKYLTEHQDISGKADKEHTHKLAEIEDYQAPDLDKYALKSDIPDVGGFIKEIPAEYITETELEAKKYLTEHQDLSGKADKEHTHNIADIADYVAPDFTNYATKEFVTTKIAEAELAEGDVDLTAYYTKSEVNALIPEVPAKVGELENDAGYITAEDIPAEYITEDELAAKKYLTEHQDISHLAEKDHVHEDYATKEHSHSYNDLTDKPIIPSLDGYAKKDELFSKDYNDLTNKPELFSGSYNDLTDKPELFDGDYNSLTNKPEIPSIEGLAKETFVTEEIKKIEIPDAYDDSEIRELINSKAASEHTHDEYALTEHTHDEYLTEQSLSDYAKKSELDYNDLANKPAIPSLEGYATKTFVDENYFDKTEVSPFITKVETLETFKTDVTANYATKQYVADAIETHEGIAKKAEVEEVKTKLETEVLPVVTEVIPLKANDVPFTDSKIVSKPVGGFAVGDDLKDLTIAQIFAKLLGLDDEPGENPDEPQDVTVEVVKQNSIPVMQGGVNTSDGSTKVEDANSTFTYLEIAAADSEKAPVAAEPGTSALYEIKNDSGEVIEHGYQIYTIASGRGTYWRVSIPVGLVIKEVQMYDAGQSMWVEYTPEFTDTGERLESNGYDYAVYQSSDRANEEILRFILE